MLKKIVKYLVLTMLPIAGYSANYLLPSPGNELIGNVNVDYLKTGENLKTLARKHDIGYYEILEANPHINPKMVHAWQKLIIPGQFILPDAPHNGIVINLAELRLYYYPPNKNEVVTFPAGIGMQGWKTPLGQFSIVEKMDHPPWHVPQSVAIDMAKKGTLLPPVVPPGPENPLGEYALRLSERSYLIHGTNVPPTVGRRASAGCLHLYPENIKELFNIVAVDTPVTIVDQPFKAGFLGDTLYLQVTQPLHEDRASWTNYKPIYTKVINDAIKKRNAKMTIDWNKVSEVVKAHSGIPVAIAALSS